MNDREQIIAHVLSLAPEDRAIVADAIEQSLIGDDFSSAPVSAEWAKEIEQRLSAYDSGETAAVDGTNLNTIRNKFACHRLQGNQG